MAILSIPLERIFSNPWQTRQGQPDRDYIIELAEDIRQNGLLQMPVGRMVLPDDCTDHLKMVLRAQPLDYQIEHGCRVQLAFGHNRLAAFRLLAASPEPGAGGQGRAVPGGVAPPSG